jgi:hypothetical protein
VIRQHRVDLGGRLRRVAQDRGDQIGLRLTLKRSRSGRHLVEDDAEREDIRSMIDYPALDLLGRHVGHGSEDRTLLSQRHRPNLGLGAIVALVERGEFGEAEVEHLDPSVGGEHHVGGFQVPVGDAACMSSGKGVGERDGDVEELLQAHPDLGDPALQALAVDQLHGDEARAAGFLDRVDRDDVGVVERRYRLGLALEAPQPVGVVRHIGWQDLECNAPPQSLVLGGVDRTHAAFTQLAENSVVRECLADHRIAFCSVKTEPDHIPRFRCSDD